MPKRVRDTTEAITVELISYLTRQSGFGRHGINAFHIEPPRISVGARRIKRLATPIGTLHQSYSTRFGLAAMWGSRRFRPSALVARHHFPGGRHTASGRTLARAARLPSLSSPTVSIRRGHSFADRFHTSSVFLERLFREPLKNVNSLESTAIDNKFVFAIAVVE
jgi:hypothetical protein